MNWNSQAWTVTYRRGLRAAALGCLLALTPLLGSSVEAASPSYPSGWIDAPAANARLTGDRATLSGWALDAGSTFGSGVDRVDIYVDNVLMGNAPYGAARSDMSAAFGPRFLLSGYQFSLDLTRIGGGSHAVQARAHSSVSGVSTTTSLTVTVVKPLGFGANAHLMWYGLDAAIVDLNRIQAAGLTSVRLDYYWSTAEPNAKGAFDEAYLTKMDGVVAAAQARGIRVNVVVAGTPGWARGNVGSVWTPPTNATDYADQVELLARRYANVPHMAYEIWNEPNQTQFWNAPGGPNAAAYTRLLTAAYTRVKIAAPTAVVLGGSIAFNDRTFLTAMYAAGARGTFDALAVHPYSLAYGPYSVVSSYNSYVLALQGLQKTMLTNGEPDKPIWITEMGWSTNDVSEASRTTYLRQAVSMLVDFPHVEQFQVYALNQAEDMPDMGLTSGSGTPTTSWTAYLAAARVALVARAG